MWANPTRGGAISTLTVLRHVSSPRPPNRARIGCRSAAEGRPIVWGGAEVVCSSQVTVKSMVEEL